MFKSGYSEEAWIAADWVYQFKKDFVTEDFEIFEEIALLSKKNKPDSYGRKHTC